MPRNHSEARIDSISSGVQPTAIGSSAPGGAGATPGPVPGCWSAASSWGAPAAGSAWPGATSQLEKHDPHQGGDEERDHLALHEHADVLSAHRQRVGEAVADGGRDAADPLAERSQPVAGRLNRFGCVRGSLL